MSDFTIALSGLPSVGKTILYRLVTGQDLDLSAHPAPTMKAMRAITTVQDERMTQIAAIINPAELAPLQVEVVDSPGLTEGISRDQDVSHEGLHTLREADVIAQVLRSFASEAVPALYGSIDVERDVRILESELVYADWSATSREIQKIEKLRPIPRRERENELAALQQIAEFLAGGQSLRARVWDQETRALFKKINLVTFRPEFYVINFGEEAISEFSNPGYIHGFQQSLDSIVGSLCGQIECEMAQIPESERCELQELFPTLRISASQFLWWAIQAMHMVTYFTFGHLGLKEWACISGASALDAAKRLHTDIGKNLIATEVFTVEDLLHAGSADNVKRLGKLRMEGRDYQVQDGDILYFRTSK